MTVTTNGTRAEAALVPTEFTYSDNNKVTVIMKDYEPWFVGNDLGVVLGHSNIRKLIRELDDDEKLTEPLVTSGQRRNVTLVNESGLYNLIFRSNKPEARAFRRWVTHEVLPAIRREGRYQVKPHALPEEATTNEGQVFAALLADTWDTHSVYIGGRLYSKFYPIMKYLGYSHFDARERKQAGQAYFNTRMQIPGQGKTALFISFGCLQRLLRRTRMPVPAERVRQLYKLFNEKAPDHGRQLQLGEDYPFRFTHEQMHQIIQEVACKPLNKARIVELLYKGGAL